MLIGNFFKKYRKYLGIIVPWFSATAIVTIIFVTLYASIQKIYRASANDPQIELTENVANALLAGANPEAVVTNQVVPIDKSLSVFVSIFDESLNPVISNANLEGEPPILPRGVFDQARAYDENRVTWEPRPGVRAAIVVRHFANDRVAGFVLAGRNLREIETREQALTLMVFIAWLVSLAIIAARYLARLLAGL
ncbi:MAG: hypothetical protein HY398_00575 [Candidatus Doudnabacteria bacterium]|nr:hypothetical protein [Candidatus Doudnabacteria bacterium]